MEQKRTSPKPRDAAREARLKAALKSNLARRKRQANARDAGAVSGQKDKD